MRNILSITLTAGAVLAMTGAASACNWNKTAEVKQTIAAVEVEQEAVTTFDAEDLTKLDEQVAEKKVEVEDAE